MSSATIHELDVRDQQISQVVVFNDRAKVHRLVKTTLYPGMNEIKLKNVCLSLIPDSLRVKGRGAAIIHDVAVKTLPDIDSDADIEKKISPLRNALKVERATLRKLEDRKNVTERLLSVLNGVFEDFGKQRNQKVPLVLDHSTIGEMQEQFSFYERNAVELKEKLGNLEEHIENAAERVKKAHSELSSEQKSSKNQKFSNVAIITVEAEKESKVEMEVVYHVHNASWSPCHDFRVNDSKPSIDITYYGKVNQNTGEDWVNAPLVLSTAKPSLMTGIPKLGTLDASLRRSPKNRTPQEIYNLHMSRVHNGGSYGPMNAFRPLSASPDSDCEEMEVAVVMYHKASEVTQNTLSAEFKISRAASILNRTDNHKVTIGIINLLPKLIHETVPSKNAAAFLTASAINTSEFEILAGEASVFLNDAFITKTKLDTISPGEEFFCSLGVDAAIRVEYKPAKKYHEEAGYINKHSANVTEQVILVKNTRLETPVFLTIKHHVPKSTDEKIRVKLIAPDATEYDPKMDTAELNEEQVERARLNAAHNLEWTVKINGGEQRELLIKWVIEHPTDATVQFSETL